MDALIVPLRVNLRGAVCAQSNAIPVMLKQGKGLR